MSAMKEFAMDEVAKHNTEGDLWVVVDGKVYDVSKFARVHPGGLPPLIQENVAGKDCSDLFFGLHRGSVLEESRYAKLQIGVVPNLAKAADAKKAKDVLLPYSEAMGTWRKSSPYYKETHHKFRAALREILHKEITPFSRKWDDEGTLPTKDLDLRLGAAGIFACLVAAEEGAGDLFRRHGITLPGGLQAEEFDYFHQFIFMEEIRVSAEGSAGVLGGLVSGITIGIPPLLKFGSQVMIDDYAIPVIKGDKRICLAISEPYAGSDVAKITTTATPRPDGGWTVTGVKKWITGGMVADYFTTLCRTEKHGMVMLLVERDDEKNSCTTRPIKTSYSPAAGTAYVVMHKADVPAHRLIGKVGNGFKQTMANFNFERWGMMCGGSRQCRMVLQECFRWALSRKVFGKALIQQPVIRFKLAEMAAGVEVVHSMLEDLTYQMCTMSVSEINDKLAGPIALLKFKHSRTMAMLSDNACQIFGGRAVTASGMGYIIEKFQRTFKFQAILGGSEEIMADFAIRQAMRQAKDVPARL